MLRTSSTGFIVDFEQAFAWVFDFETLAHCAIIAVDFVNTLLIELQQ